MADEVVDLESGAGKARWRKVPKKPVTGLSYHKRDRVWVVTVWRDGERVPCGRYRYKRDAVEARDRALAGSVPEPVAGYPLASAMTGEPVNFRRWVYYPQGVEVLERWNGDAIQADRWETLCVECATAFTFLLPRPVSGQGLFRPLRYCPAHTQLERRAHDAIRPQIA